MVLNPSIDKTCIVEGLEVDQPNSIMDQKMNIGGEGIDVSRVIKILQSEPMVLGFLGGLNGRYIKSCLDKSKIKSNFIWVNGDTKLNTLLIDSIHGTKTYLFEEDLTIQEKDQLRFKQEIKNYVKDSSVLLIDGTLPKGISNDFFLSILDHAKQYNTKIVLSTQGEELRKCLSLEPYGLKIKREDIRDLQLDDSSEEIMIKGLHELLIQNKIHYIALDMGIEGGYLICKNKVCKGVPNLNIEPNKEGSYSSAFLAAFSVGIERKYELEKILKLMVASSYATMINDEKDIICKKSDIDSLMKKIKIKEIMNFRRGWL